MLLCNCVDFAVIETISFESITCTERGWRYSGVRSAMATEEQDIEVDR